MKKAFDANVSKAKPRLRLGSLVAEGDPAVEEIAAQIAGEGLSIEPDEHTVGVLSAELKSRVAAKTEDRVDSGRLGAYFRSATPASSAPPPRAIPSANVRAPTGSHAPLPTEPPSAHSEDDFSSARRERLHQRLKAVRDQPGVQPLPETVAEAGTLALQRIASLQEELKRSKDANAELTQRLEGTRRRADQATEEAGYRLEEAKRLAGTLSSRSKLLSEIEEEMKTLESERDEAILALQAIRKEQAESAEQLLQSSASMLGLKKELQECLVEEEKLVNELEQARASAESFRVAAEDYSRERDTAIRRVNELTSEREQLLDARRALEAVHRALSTGGGSVGS